jgi:sensor c-di-GMP phosphodiesterase-like protein
MQSRIRFLRITALVMLTVYIQVFIFPLGSFAQIPGCQYDSNAPSLENARKNFKSLNYKCAEAELNDLLKVPSLDLEEKSNAHILMAAVYYAMLKDDSEKRKVVMDQFKAAFLAYREWKGELDIKSPEFMEMMKEAQDQVDAQKAQPAEEITKAEPTEDTTAVAAVTQASITTAAKKPWYKKWWAIGLGVGVVAGAVVMLSGGGDNGGTTPTDTLPSFPPPPVGK